MADMFLNNNNNNNDNNNNDLLTDPIVVWGSLYSSAIFLYTVWNK